MNNSRQTLLLTMIAAVAGAALNAPGYADPQVSGECTIDEDCDDGAWCTIDTCVDEVCDEDNDTCLIPCEPPLVEPVGSRYIAITPQPLVSETPVSFVVSSPDWACLNKYVGGFLECGDTGRRCFADADCYLCGGIHPTPCLTDEDCKTCTDPALTPCQTNADCPPEYICMLMESCVRTCELHLPLETIDLDEDGLDDGFVASLVDDPAEAVFMTPEGWGTMFYRRCSISSAACTLDSDCDVGACSISGRPCGLAAQDCRDYCTISDWDCDDDYDCISGPEDVCTVPQTCEPYETCQPGKVYLTGADILPSERTYPTIYQVQADCGTLTEPVPVTMWQWADADDNGVINFGDIQRGVIGFWGTYVINIPPQTLVSVDLIGSEPCVPDQYVSTADVFQIVLAFRGGRYNPDVLAISDVCDVPCP